MGNLFILLLHFYVLISKITAKTFLSVSALSVQINERTFTNT